MSDISRTAGWAAEGRADNVALAPRISEDWPSLIIGLAISVLALALLFGADLLGWVVSTSVWSDINHASIVDPQGRLVAGFGPLTDTNEAAAYIANLIRNRSKAGG